ncbi:hypothetical protein KC852_01585 [Candidatus Nomurabacteria bacterium]|nr:hypothetical protein [Candidatus Nomurabacteria bacterium]
MQSETKQCQNCKNDFVIESDDFAFYEKMKAPTPNYCWECRMQRRLAHRNERTLYRRVCDASGKSIISIYPENTPWPVYETKEWWKDTWGGEDFGQEYNPTKPFFDQWIELRNKVPRMALLSLNSVNSEYTNNAGHNKNCYLIFASDNNEDSMYSKFIHYCRNVTDCAYLFKSENCYECVDCHSCTNCIFSEHCYSSVDLMFCYDCRDCQDCILSNNLRHKKYMINNIQYTKEQYEDKKREILKGYSSIKKAKDDFLKIKESVIQKFAFLTKCENVIGDYLNNCYDSRFLFDVGDAKDCAYIADSQQPKDCYDCNNIYHSPEMYLDVMSSLQCKNVKYSSHIFTSTDLEYCDNCHSSSNLFGCIGLRNKKYCILNIQYTKEEYEKLKKEIIENMKKEKVYGDFLPPETSSFGYNESLANEYWVLNKDEALKMGYNWQDNVTGMYGKETIYNDDIPDSILDVDESILNEIFKDEVTGQNFRITKQELEFYKRFNLPLPRLSFDTRHQNRVEKRNPRKLYKRTTEDGVEVMTPYSPDRPEKIYSEEGYNKLIY